MGLVQFDLILFGLPTIVSAGVALSAWQYRPNPGAKPLVIHGLGSVVWILSYAAGTRLNSDLIAPGMLGVSWLAAVVVAFSGMYVAGEYTERTWLKQPLVLGSIGGYLCLEALLIGFNPSGLFYTRAPTVIQNGMPVYEFGPWWAVHLLVVFVAATAMLGMFLEVYLTSSGAYRQQARTILGGIAIIYLAAIVEVAGLEPYPDLLYNAAMAGSTVLSVTFLWALFSADFLDLTPITRTKLLDDVEDATIILDHRDRLAYSNQTAQELLDIRPEDAGMPADDVFAATAEEVRDQLVDMINDETEITLTSDGERRHFSASVSTVGDAGQSRVFVLHEITAQKEHELHIIQERDNLETLNQVLRHDLRNDLQLITAYADLLEDECETEDEQQYINTILKSADHAVELTQTARELAKAMLSAQFEEQRVNLQTLLKSEVAEVQDSYPDAVVEMQTRIPSVPILANEMISSVFRNLLKNAIQHNDKQVAEVDISATKHEDTVTVQIADNGPGVPDDQKRTIFGKGERGLNSSGTGIGLYLVDTLVSVHGGSVWVEDNHPEGSVFSVELPLSEMSE